MKHSQILFNVVKLVYVKYFHVYGQLQKFLTAKIMVYEKSQWAAVFVCRPQGVTDCHGEAGLLGGHCGDGQGTCKSTHSHGVYNGYRAHVYMCRYTCCVHMLSLIHMSVTVLCETCTFQENRTTLVQALFTDNLVCQSILCTILMYTTYTYIYNSVYAIIPVCALLFLLDSIC